MKIITLVKLVILLLVIILIIPSLLSSIILFGTDFFKEEPLFTVEIQHFTINLNNLKAVKIGIVITQTLPALLGTYLYSNDDKTSLNLVGIICFVLLFIGVISSGINLIYFTSSIEHNLTYGSEYVNLTTKFSNEILKLSIVYILTILGITIKLKS